MLLAYAEINSTYANTYYEVNVVRLKNAKVPDAEVDSQGIIHVAYFSENNIYYVSSSDEGDSFGSPMRVNTEQGFASGGLFRGPDIALGVDGRVHISWYNNGYAQKRPKSEWGYMYSRMNNAKTGFESTRNINGQPCDNFSLAADDKGNVSAIWVKDGLFINRSRDGGDNFEQPVKLKADPCECCGTRSVYSDTGKLYYLYRDKEANNRDMYVGQLSDSNQLSNRTKLNEKSWYFESCPLSGGFLDWHNDHLLAAWELEGKVYYAQVDQGGEISNPGAIKVADSGKYPVVLGIEDSIFISWKSGARLYWQLRDKNGNSKGEPHMVTTNSASRPAAAITNRGKILLFP